MKNLNKTVAKFNFKGRRYEVDKLLDTKDSSGSGTPRYMFDIYDVTDNNLTGKSITQFEAYENADFIKEAKEELRLIY